MDYIRNIGYFLNKKYYIFVIKKYIIFVLIINLVCYLYYMWIGVGII